MCRHRVNGSSRRLFAHDLALIGYRQEVEVVILLIFMAVSSLLCAQMSPDSAADSLVSVQEWGNIEIEGSLSADSISQNDTLVFTVKLKLRGNPDDYSIAEPGAPPITNLSLIATSQANRTERSEGETHLIKEYRFTYVAISIGMAYVNPLRVQYVYIPNGESRSLASSRFEIEITEPIIPKKGVDWVVVIIVLLIICAGAILTFILSKKGRKNPTVEEEEIPPEKIARQRIINLKPGRNADISKSIDDTTRILSNYIFARYGIDAARLSKEEIVMSLEKHGIPANTTKNLDMAFAICDEVRFANHKATQTDRDNIELALESLLAFGEKTNPQQSKQDDIDDKS